MLAATDTAVAWLNMAEVFAGIVGGLLLGTWVDRASRRRLLIGADLVRGLLLMLLPLAWWGGQLTVALLAGVSFAVGLNTHVFSAAYNAFLPRVVPAHELLVSNAKVRGTAAVAEAGSFSLGGVIVGLLGAPAAILIDVASYLTSAWFIARVPRDEPSVAERPAPPPGWADTARGFLSDTRAGLAWVNGAPTLKSLMICSASMSCWGQMMGVVYMLFVARELALPPVLLGVLFAVGGASSLVSVVVIARLSRRVRYGKVVMYSLLAGVTGTVCLVLAPRGSLWLATVAIVLQQLILDSGFASFSLVEQTFKQTLPPEDMLGRVNGVAQWLGSVGQVIGGVAGALLVARIGSRGVLWLAAGGIGTTILYAWAANLVRLEAVRPVLAQPAGDATV